MQLLIDIVVVLSNSSQYLIVVLDLPSFPSPSRLPLPSSTPTGTIEALVAGTLSASAGFSTEVGYDFVTIAGQRYQGTSGPRNAPINRGGTFSWVSDGSVVNSGWTICITPSAPTIMLFGTHQPAEPEAAAVQRTNDYVAVDTAPYRRLVEFASGSSPAVTFTAPSRRMTGRAQDRLQNLAAAVSAQFPGYRLVVTAAWTAAATPSTPPTPLNTGQGLRLQLIQLSTNAVATSLLGRLGSAAVAAGFDWVSYEDGNFVYASVRPDSCQTSIDLVFLIDGSGSMDNYFQTELGFVSSVIDYFPIGPNQTRVAAIT